MITINNLNFSYENEKIITDLSFEIQAGDYLGIIGPNGVGKSTLVKCLIGINKVGHDQIQIDGKCISCFKDYQKIGYVPQIRNHIVELPITPLEIFHLISNDHEKLQSIIQLLHLENVLKIPLKNLSGGQIQRVNIAKALLNDVSYLILDEPTAGLDVTSRQRLVSTLEQINNFGVSIIVISHYLEDIQNSANAILELQTNKYTRIAHD